MTVCFFKERKISDEYESLFENSCFKTIFIPVLSFQFRNQHEILQRLELPLCYRGIIMTSSRAVEAIESLKIDMSEDLKRLDVFAVGASTASRCSSLGFKNVRYENSAIELAEIILAAPLQTKPFLYFCGNIRLDDLPNSLKSHDVPFEELEVYQTFQRDIVEVEDNIDWFVFFSPSGVASLKCKLKGKIAAIGKTTANALISSNIVVDAIADKPNAIELLQAIRKSKLSNSILLT